MWLIVASLVFLRLLLWHIYPRVGISHFSDIVFGTICLTALVAYGLLKCRTIFTYPLITFLLTVTATTFINGCNDMDIKNLFTFNTYMLIVIAVQTIKATRQVQWLLGCLIGYAILSSMYGIWQVAVSHLPRATGLQGWPLSLAGQLLLFMPWAMSRVTVRSGILYLGFLSALSVLPAVSLLLVYIRNRWVLFLSLCLLIPAVFYKNILGTINVRLEYYNNAFIYLWKSPIIGAGVSRYIYSEYSPTSFVHNSYLQIWIEQGLVGFLSIVCLAVQVFLSPLTGKGRWVWLGLCAFLIDNFFSYTILKANTSFLFWVMFAAYINLYTKENPHSSKKCGLS